MAKTTARKSGSAKRAASADKTTGGDRGRAGSPSLPAASPWEWVVAGIGAVLVVAAIGYLVYFAQVTPSGPALIALEQGPVERNGDGYVVTVVVTNEGATTAAAVEIEGVLSRGGVEIETASATLDYVPRFSHRSAGLYFDTDPRTVDLELRALGYAEP
jgi:uncharacterized protein (TIGR02588 family)